MPSKEPCKIKEYLKKNDKELYQVFDDLCQFDLLKPKQSRGVTFLYPTSRVYRRDISSIAFGGSQEAVDMLKAMVILDYLPSPIDFKNKSDDIPNALRKKLVVTSADEKKVVLGEGLTLEIDESFAKEKGNSNVMIYKVSGKGKLSMDGEPATMKYIKNKSASRAAINTISTYKTNLSEFVESHYLAQYRNHKYIYKFVLYKLFKRIIDKDDAATMNKVYNGLCITSMATYYNLIRPHAPSGHCIPDTLFVELVSDMKDRELMKMEPEIDEKYKELTNEIIKRVREEQKLDDKTRLDNFKLQDKLLSKVENHKSYFSLIKRAYGKDSNRLYKDLITVYCYVSAIESRTDPQYYSTCFLYVMKNIFNNPKSVLDGDGDVAFTLTMYANLLKSDAFLYVPHTEKPPEEYNFKQIDGQLPNPKEPTEKFSIADSRSMERFGGDAGAAE